MLSLAGDAKCKMSNQVSDWTSTLARLDCTALLCWMPAHPYYNEIVLGVGKGVSVVPKTLPGLVPRDPGSP